MPATMESVEEVLVPGTERASIARRVNRRWEGLVERAATPRIAKAATVIDAILLGIGGLVAWGGLWLDDRANPPMCHGIGWGCTADPGTSMFFIGWFVLAPTFVLSTLGIWVGRRLAGCTSGRRHVGAALVVLPPAVHAVALVGLLVSSLLSLPDWLGGLRT